MSNEDDAYASRLMLDAHRIADIIRATNTDHRHILYDEVARELRKWTQNFAANQFQNLALADKTGAQLTCRF